ISIKPYARQAARAFFGQFPRKLVPDENFPKKLYVSQNRQRVAAWKENSTIMPQIFNFFSKLHAEKSGEYYYSRIVLGVTPPFTPTGVGGGHFLVSPLFVLFSYVSPSKADILNQPMKTSQIFVSSTAEKTRGVAERCIRN